MIKPVKPGGWSPGMVPTPSEIAQIDQRLAAQGLDSTSGGDTVTGTISLTHDPVRVGTTPKITSSVAVAAAGATIGTGPGGGTLTLVGTVPTYSATRTRRVRFSMLELARAFPNISGSTIEEGNAPLADPASGGITQYPLQPGGFLSFPSAAITLPLTKPHHGATITSVSLYYFFRRVQPGVWTWTLNSGQIQLQQVAVATGAITSYTSAAFPGISFFFDTVYAVTISALSVAVDLHNYVYRIVLQDPAVAGVMQTIFTGAEVNYSGIANEEFSQ